MARSSSAIGVGATLWRQGTLSEELDAKIQEASARAYLAAINRYSGASVRRLEFVVKR